jgi:hypothetical protein
MVEGSSASSAGATAWSIPPAVLGWRNANARRAVRIVIGTRISFFMD